MKLIKKIPNHFFVLAGNFLEFFDLLLYVHLAALINPHFLPHNSVFFSESLSLINIYFVAPLISVLFGFWGDSRGRKGVVVSCSILMAVATLCLMILPTYNQIGIYAGYLFITLRLLQGVALAGEPTAAALYMIESTSIKKAPFYMALLGATNGLGAICALILGIVTIHYNLSWRVPFIATFFFVIFSVFLRKYLEETYEYLSCTTLSKKINFYETKKIFEFYSKIQFKSRNFFCFILMNFSYPMTFVTSYLHLGKYLSEKYGYKTIDILVHNLCLACVETLLITIIGYLTSRSNVAPYKVNATLLIIAALVGIMMPYLLHHYDSIGMVFILQVVFVACMSTTLIMGSVLKPMPVIDRFSVSAFGFLINRIISFFLMTVAFHYMVTTYGFAGNSIMIALGSTLVCIGIYFYIPYEKLKEYKTAYTLKKYNLK